MAQNFKKIIALMLCCVMIFGCLLPSGEAFAATTVKVYFDANGGTVASRSKTVTYGSTYGELPTPSNEGYSFEGWYTSKAFTTKVDSDTRVKKTSAHTLYAKWEKQTLTEIIVTFEPNNGTVSPTSKKVKIGGAYGELPTPERTGYSFLGWYSSQYQGNKIEETTKVTKGKSHTIYAVWEKKTVEETVCGDVNSDGKVNSEDVTILERYINGETSVVLTDKQKTAADVNTDGVIDNADLEILRRHVAQMDGYTTLPYTGSSSRVFGVINTYNEIEPKAGLLQDGVEKYEGTIISGRVSYMNPPTGDAPADEVWYEFSFNEVLPGEYTLKITADLHVPFTKDIKVNGNDLEISTKEEPIILELYGDVNGDGEANQKDVVILRRYLDQQEGVEVVKTAADVDLDGELTENDVWLLRAYLAGGYLSELPHGCSSHTTSYEITNGETHKKIEICACKDIRIETTENHTFVDGVCVCGAKESGTGVIQESRLKAWELQATTDFHAENYRTIIRKIKFSTTNVVPEDAKVSWDVSEAGDGSVMAWLTYDDNKDISYSTGPNGELYWQTTTELTIGQNGGVKANPDSGRLFHGFTEVTSIDTTGMDTSDVIKMDTMFAGCSKLKEVNVSGFDTSKVTSMKGMFIDCSSLSKLNISGFNTKSVTSMNQMFNRCSALSELNLNNFDTGKVTDMAGMFRGCSSLSNLDVSKFNTSCVTNMNQMFCLCEGLNKIDISNFNTSNLEYMYAMLSNCGKLEEISIPDAMAEFLSEKKPERVFYVEKETPITVNCNNEKIKNYNWASDNRIVTFSLDSKNLRTFKPVTTLTSGKNYVIVANGMYAVKNDNNGRTAAQTVEIANGILKTEDPSMVWKYGKERVYRGETSTFESELESAYKYLQAKHEAKEIALKVIDKGTQNWEYNENSKTLKDNANQGGGPYIAYSDGQFSTTKETYYSATITLYEETVIYGDVNGDREVNGTDVIDIITYISNPKNVPDFCFETADVNADGKITEFDAWLISAFINGYINELPHKNCSGYTTKYEFYDASRHTVTETCKCGAISLPKYENHKYDNNNQCKCGTYYSEIVKSEDGLRAWDEDAVTDFHTDKYRKIITSIKFSTTNEVPRNAKISWDVSETGNGSVMAWLIYDGNDGCELTIGQKDGVKANPDSSRLFYNFTAVKSIDTAGLDTSAVTTLYYMFNKCSALSKINISNFDINNAKNIDLMFYGCSSLISICLPDEMGTLLGETSPKNVFYAEEQTPITVICNNEKVKNYNWSADNRVVTFNDNAGLKTEGINGDVNGDGKTDSADMDMVYSYLAGKTKLTDEQKQDADIYNDGKINEADLAMYSLYIRDSERYAIPHNCGECKIQYKVVDARTHKAMITCTCGELRNQEVSAPHNFVGGRCVCGAT